MTGAGEKGLAWGKEGSFAALRMTGAGLRMTGAGEKGLAWGKERSFAALRMTGATPG